MAFDEEFYTPRMISYLDLYIYAGRNGHLEKATLQKCASYAKDVLFGVPKLSDQVIATCLYEMGVDLKREVEEKVCFHRPLCTSVSSRNEDKPVLYGLAYAGWERRDNEWLKEKAEL